MYVAAFPTEFTYESKAPGSRYTIMFHDGELLKFENVAVPINHMNHNLQIGDAVREFNIYDNHFPLKFELHEGHYTIDGQFKIEVK